MYETGNSHVIMICWFLLFSMSDVIVIITAVFKMAVFKTQISNIIYY